MIVNAHRQKWGAAGDWFRLGPLSILVRRLVGRRGVKYGANYLDLGAAIGGVQLHRGGPPLPRGRSIAFVRPEMVYCAEPGQSARKGSYMAATNIAKIEVIQELISEAEQRVVSLRRQVAGVEERIAEEEKFVQSLRSKLATTCAADRTRIIAAVRATLDGFGGRAPAGAVLDLLGAEIPVSREALMTALQIAIDASPDIVMRGDEIRGISSRRPIAGPRKQG